MTKTLKDWPSNCAADFFDALPPANSKTLLDFTEWFEPLYYVRCTHRLTGETRVAREESLGGLFKTLKTDLEEHVRGPFLGFFNDLEEVWLYGDKPTGVVAITEQYDCNDVYERAQIVFYEIRNPSPGWLFTGDLDHFTVLPVREWILDYAFGNLEALNSR